MTLVATKYPPFSTIIADDINILIPNYNWETKVAYVASEATLNWGDVMVDPGTGLYRQIVAADVAYTITPTAVNSAIYSVRISVNGNVTTATYPADGTATVAEIATNLSSAINTAAGSYLTATDGTTVITVVADGDYDVEISAISANLVVASPFKTAAVFVGDKSGLGHGYATTVAATENTNVTLLTRGPVSVFSNALQFGDSIIDDTSSYKLSMVKRALYSKGIKLVNQATTTTSAFYS